MDIKIEELEYKDLKQYKNLIDNCFGYSNDIEYYKNNYKKNDNYTILVVKDENKIIASATLYKIELFTFSFEPKLEIFNLAVLEEYRRKNIASSLLTHILEYAKKNNFKSIYLTCLDTEYNAHKLYESIGFKKASSIKYNLLV